MFVCLLAGELTARIDDRIFFGTPILSTPAREHDLVLYDGETIRGRPSGRFNQFVLNSHGFRGPETTEAPRGRRIIVLGASEAFGLYERPGREFPAVLQELLIEAGHRNVEVVNASVAGMTLPTQIPYWKSWVSRFKPHAVLIYPNSQFYLDARILDKPSRFAVVEKRPEDRRPPSLLSSRLLTRLIDTLKRVPILRRLRTILVHRYYPFGTQRRLLTEGDLTQRLAAFERHLEQLALAIRASGAQPILITHAFFSSLAPTPEQRQTLDYFRIFAPHAPIDAMPAFDRDANARAKAVFARHDWRVIDASAELTGRPELFGDPVHFNEAGSKEMARILTRELPSVLDWLTANGAR